MNVQTSIFTLTQLEGENKRSKEFWFQYLMMVSQNDFIELNNFNNNQILNPTNDFLSIFYFIRNNKKIRVKTLCDSGAINSNFISLSCADKLESMGFERELIDVPVFTCVVGLESRIKSKFNYLDCSYFNFVTKKYDKITLKNILVIDLRYDLIIGRIDMCTHDLKRIFVKVVVNIDAKLIVCAMENTGRFSEVFKKFIYDIIDKSNPPLNNNSTNSSASSLKDFWTKRFSLCFQKTNAINLLSQAGNLRFPNDI
jgi:hypothetical protein